MRVSVLGNQRRFTAGHYCMLIFCYLVDPAIPNQESLCGLLVANLSVGMARKPCRPSKRLRNIRASPSSPTCGGKTEIESVGQDGLRLGKTRVKTRFNFCTPRVWRLMIPLQRRSRDTSRNLEIGLSLTSRLEGLWQAHLVE